MATVEMRWPMHDVGRYERRLRHPVIAVHRAIDEWRHADGSVTPAPRILLDLRARLRRCDACLAADRHVESLAQDSLEARSTLSPFPAPERTCA